MKLHSVCIHCQWCKLTCSRQYKQIHKAILSQTTNANKCTCNFMQNIFAHQKRGDALFLCEKIQVSIVDANCTDVCRWRSIWVIKIFCIHISWPNIITIALIAIQNKLRPYCEYWNNVFWSTKPILYYQKLMRTSISNEMFFIFDSLTQFPIWIIQMLNSPQFSIYNIHLIVELENSDNFSRILKGYENFLSEKRQMK